MIQVGAWGEGDPPILVVLAAGHDVIRLWWLLANLPVLLVAWIPMGEGGPRSIDGM